MREYFIWLAKFLTTIILLVIAVPALIGGIIFASKGMVQKERITHTGSDRKVAVVELTGEIEDTKEIIENLYEFADDDLIDGIVLRIDSPGGAVAPSQDINSAVRSLKVKKPIIASMGSLAASGGFYAAVSASKILAQPGTMTGSIGVVMQIPNVTKVTEAVGFEMITIRAGHLKDTGNSFRPMTDEERAYLEKTAATVHEQFIKDIAAGRNLPIEQVRAFSDGRVLLGEEAKNLGVIDGFGDVYDAARLVYEVKGKPLPANENPELIYKDNPFKELKKAFQAFTYLPKLLFKRTIELKAIIN